MTNKRIRQKQERHRLMPGKSLEGYEKHLLRRIDRLQKSLQETNDHLVKRRLSDLIRNLKLAHEDIRKFYFDL